MLRKWINIERVIHSIKTAAAVTIGFLLTRLVGFPADQWIVITILVVMCSQIYVGSVIQKAYLRFLGTIGGCLGATFALVMFGHTNMTIAITLGFASFIFSYLATSQESLTYAGTLGAVTTAIIMLGQTPTIAFAAERFLEISAGILIATLVSQFFLPIHARTHLRREQALTLEHLRNYYIAVMTPTREKATTLAYQEFEELIVQSILKQRKLAKESIREPLGSLYDPKKFALTLYAERELLRSITFMHTALMHIKKTEYGWLTLPEINLFNETIMTALNHLIQVIDKNYRETEVILLPDLSILKLNLKLQMSKASSEDLIYMNGLLFSAEIVVNSLERLAKLYGFSVCDNTLPAGENNPS